MHFIDYKLTAGINSQYSIRNLAEGTNSSRVFCCYLELINKSSIYVGDFKVCGTDHCFVDSLPKDAVFVFHLEMVTKHMAASI